jgi:hypothetical protein
MKERGEGLVAGMWVERLDHLGNVAGVCQEIGLAAYLDTLAGPGQQQVSVGTALGASAGPAPGPARAGILRQVQTRPSRGSRRRSPHDETPPGYACPDGVSRHRLTGEGLPLSRGYDFG